MALLVKLLASAFILLTKEGLKMTGKKNRHSHYVHNNIEDKNALYKEEEEATAECSTVVVAFSILFK